MNENDIERILKRLDGIDGRLDRMDGRLSDFGKALGPVNAALEAIIHHNR